MSQRHARTFLDPITALAHDAVIKSQTRTRDVATPETCQNIHSTLCYGRSTSSHGSKVTLAPSQYKISACHSRQSLALLDTQIDSDLRQETRYKMKLSLLSVMVFGSPCMAANVGRQRPDLAPTESLLARSNMPRLPTRNDNIDGVTYTDDTLKQDILRCGPHVPCQDGR